MNPLETVFREDIVLDEEAFDKAVSEFSELSQKLSDLRKQIEEMMNALKTGFDTPAGHKFIRSCEANLYKPMDDQKLVLEHISESLKKSRDAYQSVFQQYTKLQKEINEIS